jgi:hypothetical protein
MKKNLIVNVRQALMLVFLLIPIMGEATPVTFPIYPDTLAKVLQVKDVRVVGDSKNANVFYVLPPSNAYAVASTPSLGNASLEFCKSVAELGVGAEKLSQQLIRVYGTYEQVQAQAEQLRDEHSRLKKIADSMKVSNAALQQVADTDTLIETDQKRLDNLYKQKGECTDNCKQINYDISGTQNDLNNLRIIRQNLAQAHTMEVNRYEQALAIAETVNSELISKINEVNVQATQVKALINMNQSVFGDYGTMEGGYVHIEYDSHWGEKIKQLQDINRAANPTFSFQAIDTHDSIMHARLLPLDKNSYLKSAPAILSYTIGGQSGDGEIKLASFPDRISADLRLSLVGACPLAFPEMFPAQVYDHGKVAFGMSADYQYYSSFHSNAHFFVDESEFYKKVMNAGNSGFLWWKKSWETVDITQIDSNAYQFKWDLSDPTNQISSIERRKMEAQAVNFIIARLVAKYSKVANPETSLPKIPTSGLGDVGQGLWDLCGTSNEYCAAASWLMKGLDEIIGGGDSTSSGTRKFDSSGVIEWDDTVLESVPGSSTYNGQQSVPVTIPTGGV